MTPGTTPSPTPAAAAAPVSAAATPSSGNRPERARRIVFGALLGAWCATTFLISAQSDPEESLGVRIRLPDKVEHGIAYAMGGFLAAGAFGSMRGRRPLFAAVAFCGLWGASDEWHQRFVPGRDASAGDLAADLTGATLGSLAFALTFARAQASRLAVDEMKEPQERRGT